MVVYIVANKEVVGATIFMGYEVLLLQLSHTFTVTAFVSLTVLIQALHVSLSLNAVSTNICAFKRAASYCAIRRNCVFNWHTEYCRFHQ